MSSYPSESILPVISPFCKGAAELIQLLRIALRPFFLGALKVTIRHGQRAPLQVGDEQRFP
jgi:hypothetical protein